MAENLILQEISADVITSINTNFSLTEDAVNARAELNGDSTQKFNVDDAVQPTEAINKRQLDNSVAAIDANIATKADKTYVDANLALKANTADVNAELAQKADLNGNTAQVFNVADAVTSTEAVNKGQLDSAIAGINSFATLDTSNMPTLANNATTPNTKIDFGAGFCWDDTLIKKIVSTVMTKRLDAIFTAGTGNGGLDTGLKTINTWYHCFAIAKADGTSDFLFSKSVLSPIMPTDYIYKRRIGSVKTDTSGNIIKFVQRGGTFYWKDPITDVVATDLGTTQVSYNLSIPAVSGITCIFTYLTYKQNGASELYFYSPLINFQTASQANGRQYATGTSSNYSQQSGQVEIITDNSNIYAISNTSPVALNISTMGYKDLRGTN